MTSVGEQFPLEMRRVRHLKEQYRDLPQGAGAYGALTLEHILQRAEEAQGSGDIVKILMSFRELQGCE